MKRTLSLAILLMTVSATVNADWTARRVFDPVKNESRCVVESSRQSMYDGYNNTEVFLQVDKKSLLVMTRSIIDTSKNDIGLSVDQHKFIPLDSVYLDTNALFDKDIAAIVPQFKRGLKATITLHFWPTYPDAGAKTITVSLIGFTKAYEEFSKCQ